MQNRLAAHAEERADLDLQISLLAEREITRLLQLLEAVGEKLSVTAVDAPEFQQLKKDVPPEKVLERLSAAGARDARRNP